MPLNYRRLSIVAFVDFCFFISFLFVIAGISSSAYAANQLQRVQAAGELRVCIWPDYYGITYRNQKTHQLSGIDIDIARELGKELGVRIRYIDSSFPQLISKLLGNECDIAMHAVGITPERSAALAFTQPYLRSDIYAIVSVNGSAVHRWEDLDQKGRVIAVQAGTVMEKVMQRNFTHASLLVVKPPMSRENEVESGRADAFMTDYPYSLRMLDKTDWARVIGPPSPFYESDYAYALAPGDDSLLTWVNLFMVKLSANNRLQQLAKRNGLEAILIKNPASRPIRKGA